MIQQAFVFAFPCRNNQVNAVSMVHKSVGEDNDYPFRPASLQVRHIHTNAGVT